MIIKPATLTLLKGDKAENDGCLLGSSLFRKKQYHDRWETKWLPNADGSVDIKTEKIVLKRVQSDYSTGKMVEQYTVIDESEKKSQWDIYKVCYQDVVRHVRKSDLVPQLKRDSTVLSRRTRSKIKDKITSWYYTVLRRANGNVSRVQFNMFTLTLTEVTRDTPAVYRALNHFFTLLRKMYGKVNYLWVVEIQDGKRNGWKHATGNLHFHVVVDRFLDVGVVNRMWCQCLKNIGMNVNAYRGKIHWRMFDVKGEESLLNPVDVKPMGSIGVVKSYVTKYVTKNKTEFSRRSDGRLVQLWNCSQTVSRLAVGMYRAISFDDVLKFYPSFNGVLIPVNEYISVHYTQHPPRSYLSELLPVWEFNSSYCLNGMSTKQVKKNYKSHGENQH